MIILGIDPGTTTIGFAFIEKENNTMKVLEYGVISTPSKMPIQDRLVSIFADLNELLDIYRPSVAGVEKLFFVRNVTNGIDVAHARGIILYALASRGILLSEYTPLQVKQAITGNGMAKKPQMQKAIQIILKLAEIPKPDDAADALGIAYITALNTKNFQKSSIL